MSSILSDLVKESRGTPDKGYRNLVIEVCIHSPHSPHILITDLGSLCSQLRSVQTKVSRFC